MNYKWQWFLGGKVMFWVIIVLMLILLIELIITYFIDPMKVFCMTVQNIDTASIEYFSEKYVAENKIIIQKPIVYRFVKYKSNNSKAKPGDTILLGTFHEWNNTYFIDISVDLSKDSDLESIVIHETRHMIVEYLAYEDVVDLRQYSEEIAEGRDFYYNSLFEDAVDLLKISQEKED